MQWYRYNPITFEYEHPVICQPDPARAGEYLTPPSATPRMPPTQADNQAAHFNVSQSKWSLMPDYRGAEYWLPDGTNHKIEVLGEVLPDDALDAEPPPAPPTPKEEHDERVSKRNALLDQNDWVVMRHRDQIELGIPTTLTKQEYRKTLVRRQQLRDMSDTSLIK